jgi:hypothetical protein
VHNDVAILKVEVGDLAHKDHQEHQDHKDHKVVMVHQELQDLKVLLALHQELLD